MENISLSLKEKKDCYSAAKVGLYWEKLWTLSLVQVLKTLGIHTSVCYVLKNMHSLIDLSEHGLYLVARENSVR